MKLSFRFLLFLLCFFCLIYNGKSQSANSENDPYLGKLLTSESSDIPIPMGIIFDFNYTLGQANPDADPPEKIFYGADIYFDSWQLGYHKTELGNFIQLQPRSLGRDNYTTFFLSIGNSQMIDAFGEWDSSMYIYPSQMKGTFYMLGWKTSSGYNFEFDLTGKAEINAGYLVTDQKNYFAFGVGYDYGFRVPILNTALYLKAGANFNYVDYNWNERTGEEKTKEFGGFFLAKFTINIAYSLNFNI